MNSFSELVKSRRSIRKFLPKAVETEKIDRITRTALMSPSSKRSNPWEFIVVQDRDMLRRLAECRPADSQQLEHAPVGIVVTADTTKSDMWLVDASIAAMMMMLQAKDLDLGSCWVQVHNREKEEGVTAEEYVRKLLGIPSHYAVLNIVGFGYPDEERRLYDEAKLPYDKIHMEKF